MKLELIKTESGVILVSDKQPVNGCYFDTFISKIRNTNNAEYEKSEITKQIIAGHADLPKLDLSTVITHAGESKTIAEWIGVWDDEKTAEDWYIDVIKKTGLSGLSMNQRSISGFIKGFNKALELTSKKEFTEEDMRNCYVAGSYEGDNPNEHFENFLSSLRPNSWEVEVEMEKVKNEVFISVIDAPYEQPKITNGTIKVTNIKL